MIPAESLSVVLPNYNGLQLLGEYLPSVLEALAQWGGVFEVIVVDDCSSDGSVELLHRDFPGVRVEVNERNLGFSGTCNRGISLASHPYLLCVNTDVRMEPDSIAPLLAHFQNPEVFAVTPRVLVEREGINQGVVLSSCEKGFFKPRFCGLDYESGCRENLYAVGACVVYRTEMLRALGGYSELYSPYIFEDVDLSYRAWKRGWSSLYEPGAKVHHYSGGTISRGGKRKRRLVHFRNRFLFHWANLDDPRWLAMNLGYTFFRLLVSWLALDFTYYSAWWGALKRLPMVLEVRQENHRHLRLSDREILRRTGRQAPDLSRAV